MFFAFSRFHKPGDFIGARTRVSNWLNTPGVVFYLAGPGPDLELLMDDAWQESAFGGYSAEELKAPTRGFAHFRLDVSQTRVELVALAEETAAPSPYQSPVLQEALTDLLRERPDVTGVKLPLGPVSAEDRGSLESLDLQPVPGQEDTWSVIYETAAQTRPDQAEPEAAPVTTASGSWLELSVLAETEAVEAITELFGRYGYNQGVVIEEAVLPGPDGGAVVDPQALVTVRTYIATSPEARDGLTKLEEGLFYLGRLRRIEPLQVTERREEDWANAWKEFYQVHRVGRRTVIKPPWQEYEAQPDDLVVEIDPGMAFGTGLHPTTRLCLQLMEDQINPQEHRNLLDLGTGSGILAIAAGRLGVPYSLGLDTDEIAIQAARQNVALNGLEDRLEMETGSLAVEKVEEGGSGFYSFSEEAQKPPTLLASKLPFDAIIANIIARILVALAEPMAQALRPGGLLITSGIIGEKADEVAAALDQAGLELVERREESDWVAFAHRKR
ncbi:MAG: Ribosomal protein methyltransferase [Chloroflexi bacterium]|jgi:ribosomal protein L11 methyltransferase|nr:Ribosomal protein methyltransferase [Chloroflexota bacterium]